MSRAERRTKGFLWRWAMAAPLIAVAWVGLAEEEKYGDGGILAYGRECAERIASIPVFDCADGVEVPITVDGQVPSTYRPQMTCDRPALLPPDKGEKTDGQCVPYSRAHVLRDDPEVQIAAFCRQKLIRPAGTRLYDEVDVILHSVTSGSTCWFQAKAKNPTGNPKIGLVGTRVPPPDERRAPPGHPSAEEFWNSPAQTASQGCGSCHDSDPFFYSPFIGQTGQVPENPFGKYANDIGEPFRAWPKPLELSTRGNTCVGCHRIGNLQTCKVSMWQSIGEMPYPGQDAQAREYPWSHWMPIHNQWTQEQWEEIYRDSVLALARCCENPRAEGCRARPLPYGD